VVHGFALGLSCNQITEETGLERKRVLRALTCLRRAVLLEPPEVFAGIIEVDETYVGGQRRNQRKAQRAVPSKHGRGTTKQPVFGILCREGKVWAEVVPNIQAETLLPLITKQVRTGSTVCSDTLVSYTGVAAKGYVHRLVDHHATYSDGKGTHINGLEGFWGYLKRSLASRGGIRREKLSLFLGEFVWRYNHRKQPISTKRSELMKLLAVLYTKEHS
jgi:transposase-like protein